jgi:hypothetical protein
MKPNPIPVIAAMLLLSLSIYGQGDSQYELMLRSGSFIPEKNITTEKIDQFNRNAARTSGKTFTIIQFEQLPSEPEKQLLQQRGIELLDYIPNNAYTATVSGSVDANLLTQVKARSVIELSANHKMRPELFKGDFPAWAVKIAGTVDVWISFPKTYSYEEVRTELINRNIDILSEDHKNYNILSLRIVVKRLGELAMLPFIEYVESAPNEFQPLNYNSMYASRANVLNASLDAGGKNLKGQGVVIGIGEDGDVQSHIDFAGRLRSRAGSTNKAHATHVTGTVGGAGIIQEVYKGFAPKASIVSQIFSNIITYAPQYVQDFGMVITNNSYGSVIDDCNYNGLYDLTARIVDQQAFDLPELQHVFAAGNDGSKTCAPYPPGFKTVLGGFQSAKNVLVVGSTDYKSDISGFSSRGPVRDGRIKPEIMSQGTFVASTWTNNIYSYNNGTSMAAPGVSGGLVLLVERYRQVNAGANPKNGLLKALITNGASDKGNTGPDFKYGFGSMNLLRSVKMIEDVTYFNTTITQGATNTHSVTVPANTAQLKVLLYWQDPPATVMATKTLVNDLDLQVITPSAATILPAILDTLPGNVNITATTGADHINNIEQVVINNPAAGTYSLKSIGTLIAQNPSQEYFLAYDIIPQSLVLTNPVGGEACTPTGTYFFGAQVFDTLYVQWDDYSLPANEMYTLEFSSDGGSTWSTLSNTIPASARLYKWAIPATPTELAKIRLTKNNTALTQISKAFTITALPVVSLASTQCEGYISINWAAVPGATDYEVMKLQGDEMVPVGTTTSLNYTFSGLSKDSIYWVTVRARINGSPGRRATALSRKPNTGTCAGAISDNDLIVDAILSPAKSGRVLTSTALTNSEAITIRVKNLDDVVSTDDITVSYSINAGPPVSATLTSLTIPSSTIASGGYIDYTFAATENLSVIGSYNIVVSATKASDPVTSNNSITKVYKQLDNPAITGLLSPFVDNFDAASEQSYNTAQIGLIGLDKYDFVTSSETGRIRTFINTGIAKSGNRAITLDATMVNAGTTDSLTGTYNLATFNAAADDIRLDFQYKNHGQKNNAANKVWIRGTDADNWIEVYDLFANQPAADGSYKKTTSIEVSDLLSSAVPAQNFSTSFQVRWGQWGQHMAADNENAAGYTFDDIRFYKVTDDIQVISIDEPTVVSCGLNTAVPVKATVRNSSNTVINNIPIVLKVDGTVVGSEIIASIAANTSFQYTFSPATANLASVGNHLVEVWVDYITDTYRENDTAIITVNNLPLITSFPYLQNFELNNGSWYSEGKYNSWEYGTPVSPKINRAASGSKAWKTNIAGYHRDNELSYLISPCFDLTGMTNPTLSISLSLDIEDCGSSLCDAAWMEYSADGITWTKLGSFGTGTNWYNKNYSGNQLWSKENYTRWHVATTGLPAVNNSKLRLRFVFKSDVGLSKDGIAVDDIHIYDNVNGIYDGATMGSPVNQTIPGATGWVDFLSSGKLVASVNSPVQSMGSTDVQAYINTGSVRINSDQFYNDRNITIKPATTNLTDSATVRFYFLDSETEALINASGCAYCSKPAMVNELGVTKYSDPDDNKENGTLADNTPGDYLFINQSKTTIVPFDKGYYAEFKVKDFSEFWLNNGGFANKQPLPVKLLNFTARRINAKDVLVEWKSASENNVNRYEVEVARNNTDYQQNNFDKSGEVSSRGNSSVEQQYSFTDVENNKMGVRYYRLKIIENDGSFKYSSIRPVLFNEEISWQVNPNPSKDNFNLLYQANDGEVVSIKLYDVAGRLVQQFHPTANGFLQKFSLNLGEAKYPYGMYLLDVSAGAKRQSFKLIKQ